MENIVGVVLIFTSPVWATVALLIYCFIDRPKKLQYNNSIDWESSTDKKIRKKFKEVT